MNAVAININEISVTTLLLDTLLLELETSFNHAITISFNSKYGVNIKRKPPEGALSEGLKFHYVEAFQHY